MSALARECYLIGISLITFLIIRFFKSEAKVSAGPRSLRRFQGVCPVPFSWPLQWEARPDDPCPSHLCRCHTVSFLCVSVCVPFTRTPVLGQDRLAASPLPPTPFPPPLPQAKSLLSRSRLSHAKGFLISDLFVPNGLAVHRSYLRNNNGAR